MYSATEQQTDETHETQTRLWKHSQTCNNWCFWPLVSSRYCLFLKLMWQISFKTFSHSQKQQIWSNINIHTEGEFQSSIDSELCGFITTCNSCHITHNHVIYCYCKIIDYICFKDTFCNHNIYYQSITTGY